MIKILLKRTSILKSLHFGSLFLLLSSVRLHLKTRILHYSPKVTLVQSDVLVRAGGRWWIVIRSYSDANACGRSSVHTLLQCCARPLAFTEILATTMALRLPASAMTER